MFQYHCLNPIAGVGLANFNENYQQSESLEGADAVLVRSAAMHGMELPKSILAVARAGAGVCSRREADNFIEMERVTVNGKQPHVGQKVTAEDVVLVDGERLNVEKYIRLQEEEKKEVQQEKELLGTLRKAKPENKGGREGAKMEKFGKFNKYAAARKAQKEGGWKSKTAKLTDEEKLLRDALRPKFGKALSKSAVAQRIAANPKSAALRKTSKNNPINKAKRAAHRKNRNHEGDE